MNSLYHCLAELTCLDIEAIGYCNCLHALNCCFDIWLGYIMQQ